MEKIYQQDMYAITCDAKITDAAPLDAHLADIRLDRTCFFPEGGGQSADTGTITGSMGSMEVIDVQEDGEDAVHRVRFSGALPKKGEQVHCTIDWEHRFENMQRHCGEHILSGAFDRAFGCVNRGFHMGNAYMTIDLKAEKNPAFTGITPAMAKQAEQMANRVIWEDLPVRIHYFKTREEAEQMPLRKPLAFDEAISVVLIGSSDNPADCVACCGTHPSSTGQVGLIKIYKLEKNKDMTRIYFDAGRPAFEHLVQEHDLLQRLEHHFTSGMDELPEKLRAREAKEEAQKQRIASLAHLAASHWVEKIASSTETIFTIDPLTVDDGLRIGKLIERPFTGLLIQKAGVLLLFSDGSVDCGALARKSGLRGGGRKTSARVAGSEEELTAFLARSLMP